MVLDPQITTFPRGTPSRAHRGKSVLTESGETSNATIPVMFHTYQRRQTPMPRAKRSNSVHGDMLPTTSTAQNGLIKTKQHAVVAFIRIR